MYKFKILEVEKDESSDKINKIFENTTKELGREELSVLISKLLQVYCGDQAEEVHYEKEEEESLSIRGGITLDELHAIVCKEFLKVPFDKIEIGIGEEQLDSWDDSITSVLVISLR